MVIRWNGNEIQAIKFEIRLPCPLISPLNFFNLNCQSTTHLPFQTARIERRSSNVGSLNVREDVKCMLRPGGSCSPGKLIWRICAKRESIKKALYRLWSSEPVPLAMIW